MALYIGTNYHPHDWEEARWSIDIALMKEAGFTTVRLGHLCWDSYEPEDGVYTFEWFDRVMDLFAEAGIGVLLDISMRPAPVWVHKLCPGCNICGKSGTDQASLRRYMEDIADPAYQHYALRFGKKLAERYKDHPALFAFGLCNEIGDGYVSHSEYARTRFFSWLKKKYKTIDSLNEAWASRRWGRKLTSFDDAVIQENELAVGSPEAWLDMRRFFADGIGDFMVQLKEMTESCAPDVMHSSNHYAEKDHLGFDYLKLYHKFVDYPGMGYYPGYDVDEKYFFTGSIYMQRLAETGKPMWCLEFQTGSRGIMCGPKGALRMHALLCLLNRTQMILAWTWRSMLGGEEQYLYGLLSHDGIPTANYEEYQRIASDMKKLEPYGFPYLPAPETAVAYSYDSAWVSQYSQFQYRQSYKQTMTGIHQAFHVMNRDYNIVDLRSLKEEYKLLIVPEHIVMEPAAARTIRNYVNQGGTMIMTGYSGTVDETGKVFGIPRPGSVEDVFGIRVAGFYRTDMKWTFTGDSSLTNENGTVRERMRLQRGGDSIFADIDYYEVLELQTAQCFASFPDKDLCAVSVNTYGRGKAYYVAAESNPDILTWMVEALSEELGLTPAMEVPDGISAREISPGQYYYVNTTDHEIRVALKNRGTGVLSEQVYENELILNAYDGELVVADHM